MSEFEKLIKKLDDLTTSANTSCNEFTNILIALGFQIENCGSAGHKIARHPAVSLIEYPNYNCGHNKGEAVKRPYIKKLYKFVKQHEEILYVGRVAEFPNISVYEEDFETARNLIIDAIQTLKKIADETHTDFPLPYLASSSEYRERVSFF